MTAPAQNPWLRVHGSDYEGHMGPGCADQLAPLSAIFGEIYRDVRPARLALLGCATGNGLEHVDPTITRCAVAVDLNPEFVEVTQQRRRDLGSVLEARCADVATCVLPPAAFDLIHAALVLEYVDAPALVSRIAGWLAPSGTCAFVIQLDEGEESVTPSPYSSIAALKSVMRLVTPTELARMCIDSGLRESRFWCAPLRSRKRFHVAVFRG